MKKFDYDWGSTLQLILAVTLINLFFVRDELWLGWFGIIGFMMVGHNWRRCVK